MKNSLFLFLLLSVGVLSAQQDDSKVRDAAIDNVGSVLFDTKSKEMRARLNSFENSTAIKLHYKVDEQSLDQLGGLSEYLFKVFQSVTSPVNTNVRTIVGEFSTVRDQVLTDTLTYKTIVTTDLAKCLMPQSKLATMDSAYTADFKKNQIAGNNYSDLPEMIYDHAYQGIYDYAQICNSQREQCNENSFAKEKYESHVIHSRSSRATHWAGAIQALSNRLVSGEDLRRSDIDTTFSNQENETASPIISINNAIDDCSVTELVTCSGMLYKETGLRYLFITAGIEFWIPADSMQLFADKVTDELFEKYPTGNFVVGIWLKCHDTGDNVYVPTLLVSQNGNFLTKADIRFAAFNNTSLYDGNAYNVYKSLYRNIPKPLHVCYQVAKATGYINTVLLRSPGLIKGRESIYVHVFKHDKVFFELAELDRKIADGISYNAECKGCSKADIHSLINEKARLRAHAILKPNLTEARVHFNQHTLQYIALAQEAAKEWLESEFDFDFSDDAPETSLSLEKDFIVGSCKNSTEDVIGDRLAIASLLLTPTGLDMFVDAIAVMYYSSKGEYLQASLSGAAIFMPGNLQALNRTAKTLEHALDDLIHGSQLIKTQTGTDVILGEQIALLTNYAIQPKDYGLLAEQITSNITFARKLLPTTGAESAIYSTVRQLPLDKRTEWVTRCLYDEAFATRCLKDVEEVWKWAKIVAKSGNELKQFLNSLQNIPKGIKYEGKWFRYTSDISYDPTEIFSGMIDANNRFRKGLYLSESKAGNIIEVNSYGGTTNKILYEITQVKIDNILDLTDENVLAKLGTTKSDMKLVGGANQYEFTQEIAIWAKNRGYNGIKFFGAQGGSTDYINFVIFEQEAVNKAIKGEITKISW